MVFSASILAAALKTFLFNLLDALLPHTEDDFDKILSLLRRIHCGMFVTSSDEQATFFIKRFYFQFHSFIGNLVITIFVSIFATLAFEEPMTTLSKIIFSPTKKSNSNKENNLEIPPELFRKTDFGA